MGDSSLQADGGVVRRVQFRCDVGEARAATRLVRSFLAGQRLDEQELFACELCLAEAANNAVENADESARAQPVLIEAVCTPACVELRVTDHTAGFTWPGRIEAPAVDREHGRGLFIIQSLMNEVRYTRGQGENTLIMRKLRAPQPLAPVEVDSSPALDEAWRRLRDYERTISGMAREHCFRTEYLTAIFRCCAELGRTRDLESFTQCLLRDVLHLTTSDWFVLRLIPPADSRLVVFSASSPTLHGRPLDLNLGTPVVPAEVEAVRTHQTVSFEAGHPLTPDDPLTAAGEGAIGLIQPLLFGEEILGTLALGRRQATPAFSRLETEVMRVFTEFLSIQIVNTRHHEEQVRARMFAHEMDIARAIQRALLPKTLPQPGGFGLSLCCESTREVGGDFCDVLMLDDHTLLLVVADVMGKGVPAAIFATIMRSLVRALSEEGHQPAALLERLNRLLYEELSTVSMFITAQLVVIDFTHRRLVVASAGHCPVLLVSTDAAAAQTLRPTGTPIGVLPHTVYREQTAVMERPCCVLLHTDGLTEARNPQGEMFGQARLMNWLQGSRRRESTADQLRDQLEAELKRFRGDAPVHDDHAFLILTEEPARSSPARLRPAEDATEGSSPPLSPLLIDALP